MQRACASWCWSGRSSSADASAKRHDPALVLVLGVASLTVLGLLVVMGAIIVLGLYSSDNTTGELVLSVLAIGVVAEMVVIIGIGAAVQFFRAGIVLSRSLRGTSNAVLGDMDVGPSNLDLRPHLTTAWSKFWHRAGDFYAQWRVLVAIYVLILIPTVAFLWPFAAYGALTVVMYLVLLAAAVTLLVPEWRREATLVRADRSGADPLI